MANELSLSISASETKNAVTFAKSFSGTVTVAGNNPMSQIQNIGTSDEALDLGDVGTLGYFVGKNLDATNFLEIGHTSGTYSVKLKPAEFCAFRVGSGMTAIHAKANVAACNLEYLLIPD